MARNPQKRASGGRTYFEGGSSSTAKAAAAGSQRFKKGGAVCEDITKEKSMTRIDKRARGGRVNMSSAGGGSADKSPFSSAHRK